MASVGMDMKRTQPRRISDKKLASLGGKPVFSTISSAPKRIISVNPKAKAKRVKGYRKMLASPEYKAARAEAFERAGNKCEELIYPSFYGQQTTVWRCGEVDALHAHHLRYPKSRPLAASDLKILCKFHHEQVESQKMHKTRMF